MISSIVSFHWNGEPDVPETAYDMCYTVRDTKGNLALPGLDVVATPGALWMGVVRKVSL